MTQFKEGDTVRRSTTCSNAYAGKQYIVRRIWDDSLAIGEEADEYYYTGQRGKLACECTHEWQLISSSTTSSISSSKIWSPLTTNSTDTNMNKLTSKIKRIFNPDLQAQYKAGLIDNCGDLTEAGRQELQMLMRDKFNKEFTQVAEDLIKEAEVEKN